MVTNHPRHLVELHTYCDALFFNDELRALGQIAEMCHEARLHRDMVIVPCGDAYYDLSCKTLYGMQRARLLFPQLKYFVKTDDDTYLHLPELFNLLATSTRHGLYIGAGNDYYSPVRDPASIYYVSEIMFPKKTGPPYASGAGYVLSADVFGAMVDILQKEEQEVKERIWGADHFMFEKLIDQPSQMEREKAKLLVAFPFEDVAVGMLAERVGVRLISSHLFSWSAYSNCRNVRFVVMHYVNEKLMETIQSLIEEDTSMKHICKGIKKALNIKD
jgi:hypothetical protein